MKLGSLILIFIIQHFSVTLYAESAPVSVSIENVELWTNGSFKVYVKEGNLVNGIQGCSSNDNSIALESQPANHMGEKNILNQFMYAKTKKKKVEVSLNGCCLLDNGKNHPCIESIDGGSEAPDQYYDLSGIQVQKREIITKYVPNTSRTAHPQTSCGELIPVGCTSGYNSSTSYGTIVLRVDTTEGGSTYSRTYCYKPSELKYRKSANIITGFVCKSEGEPALSYSVKKEIKRTGDDR